MPAKCTRKCGTAKGQSDATCAAVARKLEGSAVAAQEGNRRKEKKGEVPPTSTRPKNCISKQVAVVCVRPPRIKMPKDHLKNISNA